jgi:hypothetical protein
MEWDRHSEYTKPLMKGEDDFFEYGPFFERPESAATSLRRLHLYKRQRLAYVYDFGDNISVSLHLREIASAKRARYPRIVALRGFSPEQYNYAERRYGSKVNKSLRSGMLPIIRVAGSGKREGDLLLEWSDISEGDQKEAT